MESKDTPSPSSPLTTFSLFGSLPYELRREIYLLATPPRVVHVREDYDLADDERDDEWDEFLQERRHYPSWSGVSYKWLYLLQRFEREFEEKTFPIELHPDIAYFAHNWRDRLAAARRRVPRGQTTLLRQMLLSEWPGFASSSSLSSSLLSSSSSSSSKPRQPWPPTPETPEIPLYWLAEQPEVAFELLRKTFLNSEAPIPALLHTCSESRRALIEGEGGMGYELAFGTRSHGPRTWFHFGRDTLFLGERPFIYNFHRRGDGLPTNGYSKLLSGGWWDVGQFLSRDLRRVQKLVLGKCGGRLYRLREVIANLLPLVPNLKELLLELWDQDNFDEWVRHETKTGMVDSAGDLNNKSKEKKKKKKKKIPANHHLPRVDEEKSTNRRDDGRVAEPWCCFRAEDVDAIGPIYWNCGFENYRIERPWPYYRFFPTPAALTSAGPPGSLSAIIGVGNKDIISYRYQQQLEFDNVDLHATGSGSSPYLWPTGPSIFERTARQLEEELPAISSFRTSFTPPPPPPETAAGAPNAYVDMNIDVGKGTRWNIPEISFVHVGSESAARWYCEGRHAFWRYFVAFQRAFARDKPFRPMTLSVNGEEEVPPLPPVPFFQIKWQVKPEFWGAIFRETDRMSLEELNNSNIYYPYYPKQQAWCLTHLMLQEPSRELF